MSEASFRRGRKREKRQQNLLLLLQAMRTLGHGLGQMQERGQRQEDLEFRQQQEERRAGSAATLDELRKEQLQTIRAKREGTYPDSFDPNPKALGLFDEMARKGDLQDDPYAVLRSGPSADLPEGLEGLDSMLMGPIQAQRTGAQQSLIWEMLGDPRYKPLLEERLKGVRSDRMGEDMNLPFGDLQEDPMQGGQGPMGMGPSPQGPGETPRDRSMLAEVGALYRAAMNPQDPSNTLAWARLNRLFNVPLPADVQAQSQGLGGPMA